MRHMRPRMDSAAGEVEALTNLSRDQDIAD